MTTKLLTACLALWLLAGDGLADDDCDDPVDRWQAQGKLRQMLESQGWKIRRIKVDDDCYEVYGIDRAGNRFEAKYSPASLKLRSLEIEFEEDNANLSDYIDRNSLPERDATNSQNNVHSRHRHGDKNSVDHRE